MPSYVRISVLRQVGIILLYGLPQIFRFRFFSFVIVLVFVHFASCNFYFYIDFVFQNAIVLVFVLTERSAIVLVFVFVTKIALVASYWDDFEPAVDLCIMKGIWEVKFPLLI